MSSEFISLDSLPMENGNDVTYKVASMHVKNKTINFPKHKASYQVEHEINKLEQQTHLSIDVIDYC